jgi:hypothetical protein
MRPSNHEVEKERASGGATRREPRSSRPWDRSEYQRLWLQMRSRDWRTLAVVPSEEGMSTYDVANLIMALGVHHGESMAVFDFRDVRGPKVLDSLRAAFGQMRPGDRMIFAARSISENLATIPLARATDRAVLCVSLGSTSIRRVEETIAQIGRERFLGSLVIHALGDGVDGVPVAPPVSWYRRLEARC